MVFQNYLCWDVRQVREVMNTNAEWADPDIFLAVHTEYPLTISNPRETATHVPNRALGPKAFLQSFLSNNYRHMQVAVLGDSGSGKSHFIRWMKLNIPNRPQRYVVSIPRSGISLRGVIDLILEALPEPEAQPYIDRLNQAGDERSTQDQLEERLLSCLALTIAEDEPKNGGELDLEAGLIEQLPNIFHDPHLRTYFRWNTTVIRQLAAQVLSSSEYSPAEKRREFSLQDLPMSITQASAMSAAARHVCDFLRSDNHAQEVAVKLINRNLDRAIGQVMNFTGDHLIRLLEDVRRHLRSQDQEMVLLVEDLARLQGLDLSLLEALIEEGNSSNKLCTLRWAAAITEGYYSRIPDTVKTRMNFVLSMNLATEAGVNAISEESMLRFSAKYLNAARLERSRLSDWANYPEEQRGEPPVACDICPHRAVCHSAFDVIDGVGLYPFNRASLLNSLRRLDSRLDERFNPRVLIKDVLAEVLGTYGRDLENGQFPSKQLLDHMGGPKLPPIVGVELQKENPIDASRQLTVLELWGDGSEIPMDLPYELYTSFGLQKPSQLLTEKPTQRPTAPIPDVEPTQRDPRLEQIRAWGNGGSMQDNLLNYIRPLLFDAIINHIDWDNEGLVLGPLTAGTGAPFRKDSISFRNQLTQPASREVMLSVPIDTNPQELSEAAIAIEGLYQFRQLGNWDFQGGTRLLELLTNCLDVWSDVVAQQLNVSKAGKEGWVPGVAAVEVLTVGAALAGIPAHTPSEWLDGILAPWPQLSSARSNEWRTLYPLVLQNQSRLRDIVRAGASGTKGGRRGAFVDPAKFLPTIERVVASWKLSLRPPGVPGTRRDPHAELIRLYSRIKSELAPVASAELSLNTDWIDEWYESFSKGHTSEEIVSKIRQVLDAALASAIGFNNELRDSVASALSEFEAVDLKGALKSAAKLRRSKNPLKHLHEMGSCDLGDTSTAVKTFLPVIRDLLEQLEAEVSNRTRNINQDVKDLQVYRTQIRTSLMQLSSDLDVIGIRYVDND